jgi:hypothetical protein
MKSMMMVYTWNINIRGEKRKAKVTVKTRAKRMQATPRIHLDLASEERMQY